LLAGPQSVLGGSLPLGVPHEFYPQTIEQARQWNLSVIIDSSGPALRIGVQVHPSLILLLQIAPSRYQSWSYFVGHAKQSILTI